MVAMYYNRFFKLYSLVRIKGKEQTNEAQIPGAIWVQCNIDTGDM